MLLLISIVTDLGSAQRAERFAALRLVGATPRQLAGIAAVETAITTLLGALLGIGLYLVAIPFAARVELGLSRFFPHDLMVSPIALALIVIAMIAGATAVAWWRTRRADIGPLGASRERLERPPRVVAVVPLLLGIALFGIAVKTSGSELPVEMFVIGGSVLTILGLLWAGPLLTSWTAQLALLSARDASQVIGFGHVAKHPRAAFRAVAGLVVAIYTVTVFAVGVTAAAGVTDIVESDDRLPTSVLFASLNGSGESSDVVRILDTTPGVTGTAISYFDPAQPADALPMEHRMFLSVDDAASLDLPVPEGAAFISVNRGVIIGLEADSQPALEHLLPVGSRWCRASCSSQPTAIQRASRRRAPR